MPSYHHKIDTNSSGEWSFFANLTNTWLIQFCWNFQTHKPDYIFHLSKHTECLALSHLYMSVQPDKHDPVQCISIDRKKKDSVVAYTVIFGKVFLINWQYYYIFPMVWNKFFISKIPKQTDQTLHQVLTFRYSSISAEKKHQV